MLYWWQWSHYALRLKKTRYNVSEINKETISQVKYRWTIITSIQDVKEPLYSYDTSGALVAVKGGGPRVVVSTAVFHARVRGSVPGLGVLKETKNVSSPSTCESQYCGEPPWPRGSVLGLRLPGLEFWILCLHLTILRRFSWPSLAHMCTKGA